MTRPGLRSSCLFDLYSLSHYATCTWLSKLVHCTGTVHSRVADPGLKRCLGAPRRPVHEGFGPP